jgi:hypothetical protein
LGALPTNPYEFFKTLDKNPSYLQEKIPADLITDMTLPSTQDPNRKCPSLAIGSSKQVMSAMIRSSSTDKNSFKLESAG